MTDKRRFLRRSTVRATRPFKNRRPLTASRLGFEPLEDRRLLAGYFDQIANEVAGGGGAINDITTALRGLSSAANLPLINKPLHEIGPVRSALDGLEAARNALHTNLSSLSPSSTVVDIQTAVFNALAPQSVLLDKNNSGDISRDDVFVTLQGAAGVDISIDVGTSTSFEAPDVELGIPSIPFASAGNLIVDFPIDVAYRNFNFGFSGGQPYFRTDAANELQITIGGDLDSFTAGLGFLNFEATDIREGNDLSLTLSSNVNANYGLDAPQLGGAVNLLLRMEVVTAGPQFRTDMRLDWALPNISVNTPLTNWGNPSLRFENVSIDMGSIVGDVIQNVADKVRAVLEPMQPVFDLIQARIPGLSDLSEAFGGRKIDLVFMSNVMSVFPDPPTAFITVINAANRLRQFYETAKALSGGGEGNWIELGDFDIAAPGGGSLLGAPGAALGNLGATEWSSLVANGNGINFDGFKNAIRQQLGDGLGGDINALWDALSGEFQGNGITFDIPLAKNPSGVALAMLLGQDADLVTVTGRLNLRVDKTFNIAPIPGFIVGLQANASFTAIATIGYDTRGLRDAIAPMYNNGQFAANNLGNGLWIDKGTKLRGEGFIRVAAGVGLPDIVELTAGGQLSANVQIDLANPRNLDKIRPLAGDLDNELFRVQGSMDASANVRFKAGIEIFGEFIGIDETWNFATVNIFRFDTSSVPVPPELQPPGPAPPVILAQAAPGFPGMLVLNVGPHAARRGIAENAINESVRIKRLTRFAVPTDSSSAPIPLNVIEVRAFGVTQTYENFTDVYAEFGDGDDSIVIDDDSGMTGYLIHGDQGQDRIDVNGRVNVDLFGGQGSDIIDAGSAKNYAAIHGGPGSDTISFGDGRLENMTPGAFFAISDFVAEGDRDFLKIDNSRSHVDMDYFFNYDLSDGLELYELELTALVRGEPAGRVIYIDNSRVDLYSGGGNDRFYGLLPNGSQLYAGSGDDELYMDYFTPGALPGLPREFLDYSSKFFGGEGNDKVFANDSATEGDGFVQLGAQSGGGNGTMTPLRWHIFDSLYMSGVEDTHVKVAQDSPVRLYAWKDGNVHVEAGELRLYADGYMAWLDDAPLRMAVDPLTGEVPPEVIPYTTADLRPYDSHLVVRNTPKITVIDERPLLAFTNWRFDANGPYLDFGLGQRLSLNLDGVASTFSFQGVEVTVDLTPELLGRPWDISFDGPRASGVYFESPNFDDPSGTAPNYHYTLTGDVFRIQDRIWPISGIYVLDVSSGQGNDVFEVFEVPAGMRPVFDGGFGDDVLTIDDRSSTTNKSWEITDTTISLAGVYHLATDADTVNLLAGSGIDNITLRGDSTFTLNVDAGLGNDVVTVGNPLIGESSFRAPVLIKGAGGDDSFVWNAVNNAFVVNGLPATYPVRIEGGSDYNALLIDEKDRGVFGNGGVYALYENRLAMTGDVAWADFTFDDMSAATLSMSDKRDVAHVYELSDDVDVSNQFTILGNGGADDIWVHPRDAAGIRTIKGNLGISGGADAFDRVVIDDAAATQPQEYIFYNQFGPGTTNIDGITNIGFGVGSDVEQLEVRGGSNDDRFQIDNYRSTSRLNILAGDGADVLEVTPITKDVAANFNKAAAIAFDGGAGTDSFNLHNDNSQTNWKYTRDGKGLAADAAETGYFLRFDHQRVENSLVTGGTRPDNFFLESLFSGESVAFDGGAGRDNFQVAFASGNAKSILGQVAIDGGVDGGSLFVFDSANTTGSTVHIEDGFDSTLGSAAGDNLFGPGGALRYRNLVDDFSGVGLGLSLGSGADTVYARPQSTASMRIHAGDPTSGTGDTLNLDLSQAQNPVDQDLGAGSGNVTSANRKPIHWTGIEQVSSDYVAPTSFLVVNTLDSGPGSLRQAILDANAVPNVGGPDLIRFAISGAGPHSIRPLSSLPFITDPTILDATTQPGYAGKPVVELDGSLSGGGMGLFIASGGNTVRGLAINRFVGGANAQIWIQGPGGNLIQGNYLGTNLAGNAVFPFASQASYGIVVFGSNGNVIGTNGDGVNDTVEGNVIAGNNTAGILLEHGQPGELAENNVIAGNRIGTSADGNTALGNGRMGVFFIGAGTGNRIGTNSDGISDAAERNVISGNFEAGIYIDSDANVVAGNYVGTNAAGNAPLGNGDGIRIFAADNNRIGGTVPGAGNVIAHNPFRGVLVFGGGTGNSILGNSIHDNGMLGVDLSGAADPTSGVTPNDPTDADSGSNNLQNFPVIGSARTTGTHTTISGRIPSTPGTSFRLEFFASPAADSTGYGEGQTYLGHANVLGGADFVASFPTAVASGQFISATATDPLGNTSEFSTSIQVTSGSGQANVVSLPHPITGAPFNITSPPGSTITASITQNPGVAPPSGLVLPFGFIDFTVSGVAPGSAANVTISGLDTNQITNYVKYGATPANQTNHWYSFLFGQQTDGDSAVGTGMEIVGSNMVLRMIDGGRGDDDLVANGVIVDIGGPVRNRRPVAKDLSATVTDDGQVSIKLSATDTETPAANLRFSVTSLPSQGQLSTQTGLPVQIGDTFTGAPTLIYEPGAARDGTGSDSFKYAVIDSGGSAGGLSDEGLVSVSITKAVADGKVTVDSKGIVRVGGTSGKDDIVITRTGSGSNTKLLVKINGKTVSSNFKLSSVKEIRAWGRGGNDKISVLLVDVPTLIHGGTGDDEIVGGLGSNLVFGGTGKDKLVGGLRNDLLVGGADADTTIDAVGDDIHVGGHVTNQLTDDFYRQVLQQWENGQTQDSRFKQSLTNDGAVDSLFDSLGDDWFVVSSGDLNVDLNPFDSDLLTTV